MESRLNEGRVRRVASEIGGAADELTLLDLWKIVRRWRLVILMISVSLLAVAIAMIVMSTRQYEATGEIQIQKDSSDALGLDSLMGGEASAGDAMEANVTLQTQAKILESETLGLQVVHELQLADTEDFKGHFSVGSWMLSFLGPKGKKDPSGAGLDESPNKRDHVFAVFKSNTKVAPVAGTRLIQVSYISSDPKIAADAVNTLIESLIDYNFQTRYSATSKASEWLGTQLSDLRTTSEQLQGRVAVLQRESGVFSFGGEDVQGKGTAYSTVLDQLQLATANLTQAQSNRVIRGALYEAAKAGDPEMVAGLSSSSLVSGSSPEVGNSLMLLQTLRGQEATQKAAISEAGAKFGSAYPKLEEMRASLTSVQQSIRAEQGRLQNQTKNDFEVAQKVESNMRQIFQEQKKGAEAMNNKAIQYEILHQEADESRTLYVRLLNRLKEAGVLEGLKSSNITVVEPGRVPSHPAKPNVKMYLLAAVLGGLFLGVCAAFLLEVMNSKVGSVDVIAKQFGDALLGEIPLERTRVAKGSTPAERRSPMFVMSDPSSPYSEALRSLRTAILLTRGGAPPKVLLITSSVPGEGKSTLATNLAALLAYQGKKVLLVDTDLRRPTLHSAFSVSGASGLSGLLTNDAGPEKVLEQQLRIEAVPGLSFVPAGLVPPYPAELLGSVQMQRLVETWRGEFDFIVLDSAPVLPVTDAVVLAPMADLILLLARQGVTERSFLERSFRLLESRSPGTMIGVVINAIRRSTEPYSYSYGYGSKKDEKGVHTNA